MTAVAPTDRPKSVRNSCVIKVFGGVFMLSRCFLDCSVGVGVFVTGLSQISSFFSYIPVHLLVNCFGTQGKWTKRKYMQALYTCLCHIYNNVNYDTL